MKFYYCLKFKSALDIYIIFEHIIMNKLIIYLKNKVNAHGANVRKK